MPSEETWVILLCSAACHRDNAGIFLNLKFVIMSVLLCDGILYNIEAGAISQITLKQNMKQLEH